MTRRRFLQAAAALGLGAIAPASGPSPGDPTAKRRRVNRLFLCGDVMTGRGIDQILPHPVEPTLYESYVKDARDYVRLAETANGDIPAPVSFEYIWGDVPEMLSTVDPDARIINLETAVTDHDEPWPAKGINYRMHPDNVPVLKALGADVCVLANNHVLDWQREGLQETLKTLHDAGFRTAGAGEDREAAIRPAVVPLPGGGRLLVFAFGLPSSGIPAEWAATAARPGVHFLPDLSKRRLHGIARVVDEHRESGDLVVASVHWGGNWGYDIPEDQRRFARGLIDEAGVDLVHGHSSHHPKGLEVHGGRLILYGCGDFINDYEGIGGHEAFRPDLVAAYLPTLDRHDGALASLAVVVFRVERMRLVRATMDETRWLADRLDEHHPAPGHRLRPAELNDGKEPAPCLNLEWPKSDR